MERPGTIAAVVLARLGAMTLPARVAASVLVVAAAVGLYGLVGQPGVERHQYLLNGEPVPAGHLPAMEAAFAKANLVDYEIDANRVKVPRGKTALFMAALAEAGALPAHFGSYFDRALKQTGPFTNRAQQEELINVARQNELALIIQSMKGIERAAVLLDSMKQPGLRGGEILSASVNVKPTDSRPLSAEQIASLKNLAAGAIAGLAPENVTVTDLGSGRTFHGPVPSGPSTPNDDVAGTPERERQEHETPAPAVAATPEHDRASSLAPHGVAQDLPAWVTHYGGVLGVGSLALLGLLMFRTMAAGSPAPAATHPAAAVIQASGRAATANPATSGESPVSAASIERPVVPAAASEADLADRRESVSPLDGVGFEQPPSSTAVIPFELGRMIRENPAAATHVLGHWIGSPN